MPWLPDILLALAVLYGLFVAGITTVNWVRFRRCIRRGLTEPVGNYTPPTALIVPCKGVDDELTAAAKTLLVQDYPDYEVLFVVESADDPAAAVIRSAIDSAPVCAGRRRVELVTAGRSTDCGQKIHNLRAGLERASPDAEVFAFIDSDCRPHPLWLRRLVAPLADADVGAATGYRWYAPIRGGTASALLSFWNANIAMMLAVPRRAFVWGGSMAIRRETFDRIKVLERWQGSLSDDYAVRSAVRRAGLGVGFAPQCLVLSPADMTWGQFWEFLCRQLIITRVYAASFWRYGMIATVGFLAGLAALPAALLLPTPPSPELRIGVIGAAALIWALSLLHGFQRLGVMKAAFPDQAAARRASAAVYVLGTPLWAAMNFIALLKARWKRTIVWRGIRYILHGSRSLTIERPADDAHLPSPTAGASAAGSSPASAQPSDRAT